MIILIILMISYDNTTFYCYIKIPAVRGDSRHHALVDLPEITGTNKTFSPKVSVKDQSSTPNLKNHSLLSFSSPIIPRPVVQQTLSEVPQCNQRIHEDTLRCNVKMLQIRLSKFSRYHVPREMLNDKVLRKLMSKIMELSFF